MGAFYDEIPPRLLEWIPKQKLFFVATAALRSKEGERVPDNRRNVAGRRVDDWGFVNTSPKEMGLFNLVNANNVWYQDLTGSGVETISHLREPGNGKLTIMFVALDGGPMICRLYGTGLVHERTSPEFEKFLPPGDPRIKSGCRAIIELKIECVASSCGYSIPFFQYVKDRPTLDVWARKRECLDLGIPYDDSVDESQQVVTTNGSIAERQKAMDDLLKEAHATSTDKKAVETRMKDKGLQQYWDQKNCMSLDGLPGLANLAPVSGSSTPVPYGRIDDDTQASRTSVVNGNADTQKPLYTAAEVRATVMRERRRLSSNWLADLYIWAALLVLGMALGFGLRVPLQRVLGVL